MAGFHVAISPYKSAFPRYPCGKQAARRQAIIRNSSVESFCACVVMQG
jgi:hypothetical protein